MAWRRIVLTDFGGADRREMQSIDAVPEPGDTEVRVRVLVASAALTDVMIRKGLYSAVTAKPPVAPGDDLVAVVDATAPARRASVPATGWRTGPPSAPIPRRSCGAPMNFRAP